MRVTVACWLRPRLLLSAVALPAALLARADIASATGPDPQGTIYVADNRANAIDVFAPGSTGNVAPIRTISGNLTGLAGPGDVKVDSAGNVYVSNFSNNTITEYAPGASGNVAPINTIGGPNTGLNQNDDFSLAADGTLYVGNFSSPSSPVVVFAPNASGNATPIRAIAGGNTGLSTGVDGVGADATGTLYVSGAASIEVFAPGANGNVSPAYTISGSLTGLTLPDDIVVSFDGDLYVTDDPDTVEVFAAGASGNVAPVRIIQGPNTGFQDIDDLAVDTSGTIYVADFNGADVAIFGPTASGNVAPDATISGPLTTLLKPEGVAVAGPPTTSSATLTTVVSDASISAGDSIHDTATLAGGTNPTGSIVFKLFGPNDSTCSAAPAYTSPAQTVSGDGTYPSPSFMPPTPGTYSWQALYSGDNNNAAVTTACNDPAEMVTVSLGTTTTTTGTTTTTSATTTTSTSTTTTSTTATTSTTTTSTTTTSTTTTSTTAIASTTTTSLTTTTLPGCSGSSCVPGSGPNLARSDCYVELNVEGITESNVRSGRVVLCHDGDPCDTDGKINDVCTFKVAVCIDQSNLSACHPPAGLQTLHVSKLPTAALPSSRGGSACGSFVDVGVKLHHGAHNGKKTGMLVVQANATAPKGTTPHGDRDTYVLECLPSATH